MENKNKISVFVPNELLKVENVNPKKLDKDKIKELVKNGDELNLYNLVSFSKAYPYIFDAICYICTNYPDAIKRKDNPNELRYKVRITLDSFKKASTGEELKQRLSLYFNRELYEQIGKRDNKIIAFDNQLYFDELVHITPVLKDESEYKKGSEQNFSQISKHNAIIKEVEIEFYKPVFKTIVENDSKKVFYQFPPHLQSKIDYAIAILKFSNILVSKLLPSDVRNIYENLCLHDNGNSNVINIPLMDFLQTNYRQFIQTKTLKDNTVKEYFPNCRKNELEKKIADSLKIFKFLAMINRIDGARFIPVNYFGVQERFSESGEKEKVLQFSVIRPKNPKYPKYNLFDYQPFLLTLFLEYIDLYPKISQTKECSKYLLNEHWNELKTFYERINSPNFRSIMSQIPEKDLNNLLESYRDRMRYAQTKRAQNIIELQEEETKKLTEN